MKAYSYIRFSTPEQEKGDSLRRQLKQSEDYAQAHGLTLDDSLRLTDRGLSAFKGDHRTKGALGEFHRLVDQGEVEPGSVLLVESLDRLSREQVLDALTQFTGLIRAGVKVVTLADRMEYDRESINANFGQLLMSLVIMSRAHEESATKALRGREAWGQKRREANNGHKLTAKCPAWLSLPKVTDVESKEDRKRFKVLPEVAQVVNRIFRMKLGGKGSGQIERILNAEKGGWVPPPKGKGIRFSGGWRTSYINKILSNRAVIGEYQPHSKDNGKRTPEGEPIPGYYPAIVDPELFHQVQAVMENNRKMSGNAGGRNGAVSNLFGHIAKCFHCGGPMAYINKGQPPKGGSYLVCDRARRGLDCKKSFLRYDKIEPLLLQYCKGLEVSEILPDGGKSDLAMLRSQLQGVEGELGQVDRKIASLLDSLEDADGPEFSKLVKDRVRTHQARQAELTEQAEGLRGKIAKASTAELDTEKRLQSIRDLIERMARLEGQELIDLRLALRSQLRALINQLNFLPDNNEVGMLFKSGERRSLSIKGDQVHVHDVPPDAPRVRAQLWKKPWKDI